MTGRVEYQVPETQFHVGSDALDLIFRIGRHDPAGCGLLCRERLGEALVAGPAPFLRQVGEQRFSDPVMVRLDRGPTEFNRAFGMAWGIGGWLLTPFLQKIGFEAAQKLRERVAAEIKTTFASTYTKEVSLVGALRLDEIAVYGKQATGEKYLINPNKGLHHP